MIRKEYTVCIELMNWFKLYKIPCWLNEGEGSFKVKGINSRPDLVIYSPLLNQYIAIEVKPGDNSGQIMAASKIINYWKQYVTGKAKYYVDNKEIKISSFCIATFFSMYGKLFKNEEPAKFRDVSGGLEPYWEYPKTKTTLRSWWGHWKIERGKDQAGLGIILNNSLCHKDIDRQDTRPMLFDIQWETLGKPQWRQRAKLLGTFTS